MKNLFLFKIFVFLFISLFCFLGTWQLYRLQWKQDLINQISEGLNSNPIQYSKNIKKNYQRVILSGEYNFKNQIYLYSLNEKGQPGFDVVTPFETKNKDNILINRGWIKKEFKNNFEINTPSKNITGMLRRANRKNVFTPDNDIKENIWFSINLEDVKNIDKRFREIIGGSNSSAYWSILNRLRNDYLQIEEVNSDGYYTYEDMSEAVKNFPLDKYSKESGTPIILVIDEINRGNVSAIFGELITLLEPDKRAGEKEVLEVTLPYSKEKFSVPNNLYIIGTMNTADRSVEALDTALRRRFSFTEMMPQPDLVEKFKVNHISMKEILETINSRIEYLLDREKAIGHSYFFNIAEKKELVAVFTDKIIPLLQEHFYNDYEKIGLVLGEGMVGVKQHKEFNGFAKFTSDNTTEERTIYFIKSLDEKNIMEAVNQLLGKE